MALDALVDSTQLNSDLTGIANAIRTKGGTSAQLAFPAGFVSAVEAIPTGGGGLKCDYGTFTLDADFTPAVNPGMAISHNLGEAPNVVIVYPDTDSATPGTQGYMWFDRMVDLDQAVSSVASRTCSVYSRINVFDRNGVSLVDVGNGGAQTYTVGGDPTRTPTAQEFYLFRTANGVVWAAGDYKYFVSEGWWLK